MQLFKLWRVLKQLGWSRAGALRGAWKLYWCGCRLPEPKGGA